MVNAQSIVLLCFAVIMIIIGIITLIMTSGDGDCSCTWAKVFSILFIIMGFIFIIFGIIGLVQKTSTSTTQPETPEEKQTTTN